MRDSQLRNRRLRDCIQPGVLVLFVGINPGIRSAQTGHHFAGHSNRFWKLLYESKLVSEPLTYREDRRLPEWRLGLTNIIGRSSAGIDALDPSEYRAGLANLKHKILRYRPRTIAFLGVTIYRLLFADRRRASRRIGLGPTATRLAGIPVFILPNPSGRNAHYPYRRMLAVFRTLRRTMDRHRSSRKNPHHRKPTRQPKP